MRESTYPPIRPITAATAIDVNVLCASRSVIQPNITGETVVAAIDSARHTSATTTRNLRSGRFFGQRYGISM